MTDTTAITSGNAAEPPNGPAGTTPAEPTTESPDLGAIPALTEPATTATAEPATATAEPAAAVVESDAATAESDAAVAEPAAATTESDGTTAPPEGTTDATARPVRRFPLRRFPLRWFAAAVVLAATATAAAAGVMAPARTDLPGLKTPNDGRYAFPQLTLPPLPPGKETPNTPGSHSRHYADLRALLLPAPNGVSTAPAAWSTCAQYLETLKKPEEAAPAFAENACLAATQRIWTTPDGTRTEIWLLKFDSDVDAGSAYSAIDAADLKDVPPLQIAAGFEIGPSVTSTSSLRTTKDEAPGGAPVGRVSYVTCGDVVVRVVMTNPKGVPGQAYRQVTLLQAELLD